MKLSKLKFILMASLLIASLVNYHSFVFAQTDSNILYFNESLVTEEQVLEEIAEPVGKNDAKFSVPQRIYENAYYIDGKITVIQPENMKEVTQKIRTRSAGNKQADEYVSDCFVTFSIKEKDLSAEEKSALGIEQSKNSAILPRRALQFTDEDWDGSFAMKVRYTVYYSKLDSYGNLVNLYSFHDSYGKVVSCATSEGITPTRGDFYVSLYGLAYNLNTNQYLGLNSHSDSGSVYNPQVGEAYAYQFDLGPDYIYYQVTDAHTCGTSWTVYATRGVTASVGFNP